MHEGNAADNLQCLQFPNGCSALQSKLHLAQYRQRAGLGALLSSDA